MNKKIASEIAIGVIILTAIIIGGTFWVKSNKKNSNVGQPLVKNNPTIYQDVLNLKNWASVGDTAIYQTHYPSTIYKPEQDALKDKQFNRIYAYNLANKQEKLLLSDENQNFLINDSQIVGNHILAVDKTDRQTKNSNYEYINLDNGSVVEGSVLAHVKLPLPDGFGQFGAALISSDKHQFIYSACESGYVGSKSKIECGIFSANEDWSQYRKIYSNITNELENITNLAISPDGSRIAFSYGITGVGAEPMVYKNLFIINSDGSDLHTLNIGKGSLREINVLRFTDDSHVFVRMYDKENKQHLVLFDLSGATKDFGSVNDSIDNEDIMTNMNASGEVGFHIKVVSTAVAPDYKTDMHPQHSLEARYLYDENKNFEIAHFTDQYPTPIGWYK